MASAYFLILELANKGLYALRVEMVREIFWVPELTMIEEAPHYMAGSIVYRGDVVPIMDLDARLGRFHRSRSMADSIVLLEKSANRLGLMVPEVRGVEAIDTNLLTPVSGTRSGRGLMPGQARIGDRIVSFLNEEALFAAAVKRQGKPRQRKGQGQAAFFPDADASQLETLSRRSARIRQTSQDEFHELVPLAVIALGGEHFGISLTAIKEFTEVRELTPVPCCPDHIVGNMNLRGDVVTLVDIRGALNLPHTGVPPKAIIAAVPDIGVVGVPIDGVDEIAYLPTLGIKPIPTGFEAVSECFLSGIAHVGQRELPIISIESIFAKGDLLVDQEA